LGTKTSEEYGGPKTKNKLRGQKSEALQRFARKGTFMPQM